MIELFILQVIAAFILGISLLAFKFKAKLPITLYNLPTIIITIMCLLFTMWLSAKHIMLFIPTGIVMAIIIWFINSAPIPGEPPVSIFKKIVSAMLVTLFWNHTIVLLMFVYMNSILPNNEKLQP
jgi:hypothetical protein